MATKPDMMALALELRHNYPLDRAKARALAHALHDLGSGVLAAAYGKGERADERFNRATAYIAENDL